MSKEFLDDVLTPQKVDIPKINKYQIEVPKKESHAIIVPFGDVHYGHKHCDIETLKVVLQWMYDNKNVYVIGMGDLLESSVIDSPGVFDQNQFLDDQLSTMVSLLKPLADEGRLIGLHCGNHEYRVTKHTGLDITKLMCQMLKVKYLGEGIMHLIQVRQEGAKRWEKYTMYTTHGSSNAWYPHTKIMACMRLQQIADAEIFAMGHVHTLAHQKLDRYVIDLSNGTSVKKPTHFLLTGAYLSYWGSYAHRKGYPPSGDSGSPKIKLHSDYHRISVSL